MIDRRSLLMAAGALPMTAAATFAATPKAEGSKLRWAVVGLGSFATGQMLPAFAEAKSAHVTAFVSGSPDKTKEQGARYGVTKFYDYQSYDSIASDPEIDAVYIALPVGMHAEYTIRALKAGKHVLCEKPMASTAAECEAMVAAAKAAGKVLAVGYRCHFEPVNQEAHRRLKAGVIGTVRHISGDAGFDISTDFPPHIWRQQKAMAGGGSMYDIGIYALNATLWAAGEDPVAVSAVYAYPRDDPRFTEVEGGIDWRLRFASGINAQGSSSYCYTYTSRHQMFGSQGNIVLSPSMDYRNIAMTLTKDFRSQPPFTGDTYGQFVNQIEAFAEAVRTNTPHPTPGEMGWRDIRIVEALYKSADAGGVEVTL